MRQIRTLLKNMKSGLSLVDGYNAEEEVVVWSDGVKFETGELEGK